MSSKDIKGAKDIISEATAAVAQKLDEKKGPLIDKEAHKQNLSEARDALAKEFQTLLDDTERLLEHTANSASEQTQELRNKLKDSLQRGKEMFQDQQHSLQDQGSAAIEATEEYVVSHPWQSVGIAAGIGFVLGLLTCRR